MDVISRLLRSQAVRTDHFRVDNTWRLREQALKRSLLVGGQALNLEARQSGIRHLLH